MILVLMNKWLKNLKEVLLWFKFVVLQFCLTEGKVQNVGFKIKFKFLSVSKNNYSENN